MFTISDIAESPHWEANTTRYWFDVHIHGFPLPGHAGIDVSAFNSEPSMHEIRLRIANALSLYAERDSYAATCTALEKGLRLTNAVLSETAP